MVRTFMMAALAFAFAAEAHAQTADQTRATAQSFMQRAFQRNDMAGAYQAHAASDLKEHDPLIADGLEAHRAYFRTDRRFARRAHVIDTMIVDGDLFAVLHHGFRNARDRGAVVVDIWRVGEGGRIVEHWNVVQEIPETSAHRNGMACGTGETYRSARALRDTLRNPTCGLPDPNASRDETRRAVADYLADFGRNGVRGAIERGFAPDYRQHSPTIEDGAQGAIAYLEREFGNPNAEKPRLGPQRILAEGDLILFHHQVTYPGQARPMTIVDLFRVTNGKISEHWDVKQETPATAANDNGMW